MQRRSSDRHDAATTERRLTRSPRRQFTHAGPRPARPHPAQHPPPRANPARISWAAPQVIRLPWPLAWALVALGLAGVALALRIVVRFPQGNWVAGALLLLAAIALATAIARAGLAEPVRWRVRGGGIAVKRIPVPGILVFFAITIAAGAAIRRWEVDLGPAGWGVGLPWLVGVALCGLVAWWPALAPWLAARRAGEGRTWTWPAVSQWLPWVALTLLAGLPRLLGLGRYPSYITGDEGEYLTMAVRARDGLMPNPFVTGWLEVPLLYPAAGGWIARVAGHDLAGHRLIGGLVGTIGVLAAWRFGRYVVGAWPAFAGAALLATLPFHLVFSRTAMNHIADPTTLMLSLLFLVRALRSRRRGDAFTCGVMLGLSWFGYWNARFFPLMLAVILAVMASDRRVGWRAGLRIGGWSALGFLVTAMPLLVTYAMHPLLLRGRFNEVSPVTAGAWRDDPAGVAALFFDNLREAALFPFVANHIIWFRHEAPYFGWPLSLLIAFGAAAWIAALVRARDWRSASWFVIPVGLLTLGQATTKYIESQRFIAALPIWMLLAGCGVVAIARWLTLPRPLDRTWARAALTLGIVAALTVGNLRWIAADERQFVNWGDPHGLTAWDIGWRLAHAPDGAAMPAIWMAGEPYLFLDDWDSLTFQAPGVVIVDIPGAIANPVDVPPLPPNTILLLTGERSGERCTFEWGVLGSTVAEVRARNGVLLYMAFYLGDLSGWSTAESPEGTTFTVLTDTPCVTVGSGIPERVPDFPALGQSIVTGADPSPVPFV